MRNNRKLIALLVVLVVLLSSCSDSVSKEDYDALVSKLEDKEKEIKKKDETITKLRSEVQSGLDRIQKLDKELEPYRVEAEKKARAEEEKSKQKEYSSDFEMNDLVRNQAKHQGALIEYEGIVTENSVHNGFLILLMWQDKDPDTTIIASIPQSLKLKSPINGDDVTIYGKFTGTDSIIDGSGHRTMRPVIQVDNLIIN